MVHSNAGFTPDSDVLISWLIEQEMMMATGINGKEQHSADAVIASSSHLDSHPLPEGGAGLELTYKGKLGREAILHPLKSTFLRLSKDEIIEDVISPNSFVLADNLVALHNLKDHAGKIELIYLDPPYNTGFSFQSRDLKHAYNDNLGDAAYLEQMRRRLILMRELLSNSGSIYLHIGEKMLFHIKIIMDEVFGSSNFRSLITRRTCSSKNSTKNNFGKLNDYILYYTKSSSYKWNQPGYSPDDAWISKEYNKKDSKGKYKLVPIHAPGTRHGLTGAEWKSMMPPPGKHWQLTPAKLDALDAAGEIHWSKNGNPRRKVYLTEQKRIPYTDYWSEFRDAHHQSIAVTGYPTEKNLSMLEMIVGASSDEGDIVLDPFCGSGTTLHAANNLNRKWIGIDQSFEAAEAVLKRLRYGLEPMGDFVMNKKDIGSNIRDLFELEHHPMNTKVAKESYISPEFSFLVCKEVVDMHGATVRTLASV